MSESVSDIPKSIGVIVDGNRRWARGKGLSPEEGHVAGREKFRQFVAWAAEVGVGTLLAYTFSSENWNRPKNEVERLMSLLELVLREDLMSMKKQNLRVRIVGDRTRFSAYLQELFTLAESETAGNSGMVVALLLSYGGREEILVAVKKLLRERVNPELLTEQQFSGTLWTHDIVDPDMIIRTSGEKRLSNFLPWQGVYAELFFTETLWPDFSKEEFLEMLAEYGRRERRFGK